MILIETILPDDLINNLKKCENIIFKKCFSSQDIPIMHLNNSDTAMKMFLEYLQNDDNIYEKHGPVVMAHFGHPMNPYINPSTQVEVLNLLNTYQQYNGEFIPIVIPPLGGNYQYNSNKSIYLAYLNIQNLESETTICDLNITFANILVTISITPLTI